MQSHRRKCICSSSFALGVYLTPTLNWSTHIHYVCLKANRKLAVLRSVKQLSRSTLDLLYKLTVRSIIDYAMPVYYGNLKLTEKKRLDQIQYRAAKLVTGALHYTSGLKLNIELGWETLQTRFDCLGLGLFHKIHLGQTRPLVKMFMSEIERQIYNTRVYIHYKQFPYINKQFASSFYPYFTKKWNSCHKTLKNERDINEYKIKFKNVYKPPKYKFYYCGSTKVGCSYLTRLRVGRSVLNDHAFSIGLSSSPECQCHAPRESPEHMLLKCFLYNKERPTLMSKVEKLLPKFGSLKDKRKLEILLFGIYPDNPDFYQTNKSLQIAVQQFLVYTNRFDNQ